MIWGSTWLVITFQLGDVAPEASVAYRFALGSAILFAWCAWRGLSVRFAAIDHAWLATFGVLMCGLNYIAIYWAERYVASGLVAIVFSTIVFASPIGMRVFYGQRIAGRTWLAALLGVSGVALLFLPTLREMPAGDRTVLGIVLALVGTASATLGNLAAVRNQRASLPILSTTAWGMAYGAATAVLAVTITGATWTFELTPGYVLSLLYLAVLGSVVAFVTYLELLARVGVTRSSFVGVATPVIAIMLSTLFEGYRWTPAAAVGIVLAVAGNVIALRGRR